MELFWNEATIIVICSVIFLLAAYRPISRAINSSLEKKITEIRDNLAETKLLKAQAVQLFIDLQKEIEDLKSTQQQTITAARSQVDDTIKEKLAEANTIIQQKEQAALDVINNQKAKASNDLQAEFLQQVLSTVKDYLKDTNNNHTKDEEIVINLLKK